MHRNEFCDTLLCGILRDLALSRNTCPGAYKDILKLFIRFGGFEAWD